MEVFQSSQPGSTSTSTATGVGFLGRESLQRHPKRSLGAKIPRSWVACFAALAAVYIITAPIPRLFDQIDGQYAGAAREMIERGDWLIPTQNGVPRLQKPPLVYWCEIASMQLFGLNEFGARLPVALAAIAWFAATGLVAARVIGTSSAGVVAATAHAAFAGSYFFCHLIMPEPFIGFFVALAFWALLGAIREQSPVSRDRWLLAAWTLMALGALSKGMHALLLPVVSMLFTAWARPSVRPVCRRFLLRPQGWVVFLVILAPWYAVVESRYPGFIRDHFLNEQLGPALSRRWPPDSHRVPLLVFWLQHLLLFLPMTLLLPLALKSGYEAYAFRRKDLGAGPYLLFFWFLTNALGISFANLQDYYLMVAWPPVAVLIGWAVSEHKVRFKWPAVVLMAAGAAGLMTFAVLSARGGSVPFASATNSPPVDQDTIIIVLQSLPSTTWAEMIPLLGAVSGVGFFGGILVYLFDRSGKRTLAFSGLAGLMAVIFLLSARALVLVQDELSSATVAEVINKMAKPESMVIVQGDPNEETSLFFYLHRTVYWVNGHPDLEFATRQLLIGRDHYLDRSVVAEKWKQTPIFLVIQSGDAGEWERFLSANPPRLLGRFGAQTILANHL